ncbi:hypothetical protein B7494_g7434 [Chlorociboria aeruginascens]|nr:hypothetical protein B7494_g7434 [Chlorociboria aeruginascens]
MFSPTNPEPVSSPTADPMVLKRTSFKTLQRRLMKTIDLDIIDYEQPAIYTKGNRKFTIFGNLPLEMRLDIWKMALPQGPRIIPVNALVCKRSPLKVVIPEVQRDPASEPEASTTCESVDATFPDPSSPNVCRVGRPARADSLKLHIDPNKFRNMRRALGMRFETTVPELGLLTACRESRSVSVKTLPHWLPTNNKKEIRFNGAIDTIYNKRSELIGQWGQEHFVVMMQGSWGWAPTIQHLGIDFPAMFGDCYAPVLASFLHELGNLKTLKVIVPARELKIESDTEYVDLSDKFDAASLADIEDKAYSDGLVASTRNYSVTTIRIRLAFPGKKASRVEDCVDHFRRLHWEIKNTITWWKRWSKGLPLQNHRNRPDISGWVLPEVRFGSFVIDPRLETILHDSREKEKKKQSEKTRVMRKTVHDSLGRATLACPMSEVTYQLGLLPLAELRARTMEERQ